MPKSKDIIIFKKSYELALDICHSTKLFPKNQRFLMANRLEELMIRILERIIQANETQDKLPILKELSALLERFDEFKRRVSPRRFPNSGFILKGDIKNYYLSISHSILISCLRKKILDERIIWLVKKFINLNSQEKGISMGNPLSQLFANIYLNELDYFVKHILREECYLRYSDDFAIFKKRRCPLEIIKAEVGQFLKEKLFLKFNIDKTKIVSTNKGLDLLGYKVFYHYKLLRKRNVKAFKAKLKMGQEDIQQGRLDIPELSQKIKGWVEYARYANSYKLRKKLLSKTLCS